MLIFVLLLFKIMKILRLLIVTCSTSKVRPLLPTLNSQRFINEHIVYRGSLLKIYLQCLKVFQIFKCFISVTPQITNQPRRFQSNCLKLCCIKGTQASDCSTMMDWSRTSSTLYCLHFFLDSAMFNSSYLWTKIKLFKYDKT